MEEDKIKEVLRLLKICMAELTKSKYLIIIPAGDRSRHLEWKKDPSVDLCVIYYNDNPEIAKKFKESAEYFYQAAGPKWSLLKLPLRDKIYENYKYIWLPDDDLIFENRNVGPGELFDLMVKSGADLAQPALIDNGNILPKYKKNLQYIRKGYPFRKTRFVEIMAPMFSINAFKKIIKTIMDPDAKSGWGLDTVWPMYIPKMAILNAVPIIHTVPISKPNMSSSFYAKFNIDPYKEMNTLITRYKLTR